MSAANSHGPSLDHTQKKKVANDLVNNLTLPEMESLELIARRKKPNYISFRDGFPAPENVDEKLMAETTVEESDELRKQLEETKDERDDLEQETEGLKEDLAEAMENTADDDHNGNEKAQKMLVCRDLINNLSLEEIEALEFMARRGKGHAYQPMRNSIPHVDNINGSILNLFRFGGQ